MPTACGQRGDRLFDAYDADVHARRSGITCWSSTRGARYVSASAIAEGGILLRLFEARLRIGTRRAGGI